MKKRKGLAYNLINLCVLGLTLFLFVNAYVLPGAFAAFFDPERIPVLILTVLLVHAVKALRLYLALYGLDMSRSACMKLYCKVTPVSVVLPWKLGEFFRIYCCGAELGSFLKGIVIILLDRVFDTVALVTMILLVWLFSGGVLPPLIYALLIFLGLVLLMYFAFPGMHEVWKHYLLSSKATANKLAMLKFLDGTFRVYREIKGVLHGRGCLLYILSVLAWAAEIGSLVLLQGAKGSIGETVSRYLSAALGMGDSPELKRFVVFTILLLILAYILIKLAEMAAVKRSKR